MLSVIIICMVIADNLAGIIFPSQWDEMRQKLKRNVDDCGSVQGGEPWCENIPDYPDKNITYIIRGQRKSLIDNFFDNLVTLQYVHTEDYSENICDTRTRHIKPRRMRNKNGRFMFIVNEPEGSHEYIQLVRVTTCTAVDEECAQGQLISSISTRCQQEYSDHKLVALSESGEELVVDTFSFPSCCSCVKSRHLEY